MSSIDLIWIIVFIALLIGTLVSAWQFFKVIDRVNKGKKNKDAS